MKEPTRLVLVRYPAFCSFFLSVLTLAPFASGGLDVTDPEFHLANQQMDGRIGLPYIFADIQFKLTNLATGNKCIFDVEPGCRMVLTLLSRNDVCRSVAGLSSQ